MVSVMDLEITSGGALFAKYLGKCPVDHYAKYQVYCPDIFIGGQVGYVGTSIVGLG